MEADERSTHCERDVWRRWCRRRSHRGECEGKERRIGWEKRGRKNAEDHINACKTAVFHLDSGSQSENSCIALFFQGGGLYLEQEPSQAKTLVMERKRLLYPTTDAPGTKSMTDNSPQRIKNRNCINTHASVHSFLFIIFKKVYFSICAYCPVNTRLITCFTLILKQLGNISFDIMYFGQSKEHDIFL